MHVFWDCKTAYEVLTQAPIALLLSASPTSHVQQWLLDQVTLLSITSFSILLMMIWAIWRNRNFMVWEEESKTLWEIVPLTLGWWKKYRVAHVFTSGLPPTTQPRW